MTVSSLRTLGLAGTLLLGVTASAQVLDTYKRNLTKHCEKLATECRRIGGRYALYKNNESLLTVIKHPFKSQGWLVT